LSRPAPPRVTIARIRPRRRLRLRRSRLCRALSLPGPGAASFIAKYFRSG
jgi:hypothetical protein